MKRSSTVFATVVILLNIVPLATKGINYATTIENYGTIKCNSLSLGITLNTWSVPDPLFEENCALAREISPWLVRTAVRWDVAEPIKGVYDWEESDYKIGIILGLSLAEDILVVITNSPPWASNTSTETPDFWTYPPTDAQDFKDFVTELVNRYKDKVKYWEIWNEPNLHEYWKGTEEQYSTLLRFTYEGIKSADPDAVVISGGMSNADFDWTRRMYESGWKPYFDILGIHPYCEGSPLEEGSDSGYYPNITKVLDVMREYGDGMKFVWITEIGWNTYPNAEHFCATEEEQAEWLRYAYAMARNDWPQIRSFGYYIIKDSGTDCFGLVRADGTLKPSWFTYKDLAAA
jgi:hypothetical protein